MTQRTTNRTRRPEGCILPRQGARTPTWQIRVEMPGPGERRRAFRTVKGDRKAAERELRKMLEQAERGVKLDGAKLTLAAWIETWLEDHIRHDVATRTFERYRDLLRLHVAPHVGATALRQLGPDTIERLYHTLAKSGRRVRARKDGPAPSPAGLAPRTINHVHRVLFKWLKDATRLRQIDRNPAADVKRPRLKRTAADAERPPLKRTAADAGHGGPAVKMRVLDRGEITKLLDGFRARNLKSAPYPLVLLALDSGARRGELLALRWSDLDTERRAVRIEQAVDDTKARGVEIKPELKNDSSRRTVAISTRTVDVLRDEWRRQVEVQLKLGRKLPTDALVFPVSPETPAAPLRPREVTKAFGRVARDLGLSGLRFHDLRHNCASHMLKAGRPVPEVARHLGHKNPAVTMSVYAHVVPGGDGAAGLLDVLLPSAASSR